MKMKMFLCAAAAAMTFAGCAKEGGGNTGGEGANTGVAYLSINVAASQGHTRFSGEDAGKDEADIKKLFIITFDAAGNVVPVPGSGDLFTEVTPNNQIEALKPKPHKIAASSKNLVVIANPGTKLEAAIRSLGQGSTFVNLNVAIASVTGIDEVTSTSRGFAMITAGDEAKATAEGKILYPYVSIEGKIKVVSATLKEDAAIAAANIDRQTVRLERLAAKLVVMQNGTIADPKGAAVNLNSWTVDCVNTTYYPFAEKTLLNTTHNQSEGYTKNFYTKDPNYFSDPTLGYATGLERTIINADYSPKTVWNYGWKNPGNADDAARIAYVLENTMDGSHQMLGSATRIIMKATYTPAGYTAGADWFSWAGVTYESLEKLKDAYKHLEAGTDFKDACDRFAASLKKVNSNITTFADLSVDQIKDINNGGQVAKEGNKPVIRWYQGGQCYYSYEVRHDNEITGQNEFAKYGVVRNNWYDLTLKSVKGPGTPWYPEAVNPGPGDPDPKEPIDTQEGFVGIDVKVNKWVIWKTNMEDVD